MLGQHIKNETYEGLEDVIVVESVVHMFTFGECLPVGEKAIIIARLHRVNRNNAL